MGVTFSSYYDLVKVREIGPEAKDWATTDKNFEIISLLLKAFENHVHTGLPGLAPPGIPVTMTIATPAVVTLTAHGFTAGTPITFYTTGWLPTGVAVGTTYYVSTNGLTANAFQLVSTIGGPDINTSGTQSGTHSIPTQPVLTEVATGGSLSPGTTIGVRISYSNAQGLETNATVEQDITLSAAATRPLSPTLNVVQAQANALAGGTYMYVMTKVKGTGETDASDALAVSVPYDQTYSAVINFAAISTYTDGTTQYNIYRSAGLSSSFQLVGVITDVNATAFTDLNTSVDQTAQPPSVSTFGTTKSLTIDWTKIGTYPPGVNTCNVYVTQQPGVWSTTHLLTSISITGTPPTTVTYLGSETLSPGYPYDITQIPRMPPPIDSSQLASGVGGSSTTFGAPPIGALVPYAGNGDPPAVSGAGQWIIADGRLINSTSYNSFFTNVGHAYNGGVDPGGGQVRIPDKRGKKSAGAINMGSAAGAGANDNAHGQYVRGVSGGEAAHTLGMGEIPSPTVTDPGHIHAFGAVVPTTTSTWSTRLFTAGTDGPGLQIAGTLGASSIAPNHTTAITLGGGGGSHNVIDPYESDCYLVRIA